MQPPFFSKDLPHSKTEKSSILYILDQEGILYKKENNEIYYLNASATFIWCCIEEGFALLNIARLLAERFDISIKTARRDIVQAFNTWRESGLLSRQVMPNHIEQNAYDFANRSSSTFPPFKLSEAFLEHSYRLLDVCLKIRYPCHMTESLIHPVFKHLEIVSDDNPQNIEILIDIVSFDKGYVLFKNGVPSYGIVQTSELAPLLQKTILLAAYENTDCMAAIHAAAICNDLNLCIVLPAMSGSGKSTLTAGLLSAGFTYLTDELVLLTKDAHTIRPAFVSLALKRNSWPILANTYLMDTLPVHVQEDAIEVKYLPPPSKHKPLQQKYHIGHLVFPKYRANAPTKLTKITPAKALYLIAEAGYDVPNFMNEQCLESLIDWIMQLDCYELQMSNLNDAVCLIKGLFT